MTVTSLWRYPVKTLGGEPIQTAELTVDGIPGDRVVHVRGPEGRSNIASLSPVARPIRITRLERRTTHR